MTGNEMLSSYSVRATLNDVTATRWTPAMILGFINECRQILWDKKPETYCLDDDDDISIEAPAPLTTLDQDMLLRPAYNIALSWYVIARCQMMDGERQDAGQVKMNMALFAGMLGGQA